MAAAVISDVTELAVPSASLGEGPCWDAKAGALYWTDIPAHRVHRLTGDGTHTEWDTGQPVGAVVPRAGGGLVLAARDGFLAMDPGTGSLSMIAAVEPGIPGNRMNDGACDRAGRFFAGTMAEDESPGAGALYLLATDHQVTRLVAGAGISNGIGWSPDGTTMYLADSGTGDISAFDFDPVAGELSHQRTVVHIATANAVPDGLTVDHHGGIWVALWNGGALARYRPDGLLLATVPLPVDRPTSCAFGGTGAGTLFVTTAREGLDEASLARQPDAGRLLRLDPPGVTGPPCAPYRGPAAT